MKCKSLKTSYNIARANLPLLERLKKATGFFILRTYGSYGTRFHTFETGSFDTKIGGPLLFTWDELLSYLGGKLTINKATSNGVSRYSCFSMAADKTVIPVIGATARVDSINTKPLEDIIMLEDGRLLGIKDVLLKLFVERTLVATGTVISFQTYNYSWSKGTTYEAHWQFDIKEVV